MTDPFQDVDSVGPAFVEVVVTALEERAVEASMVPMIERYLDHLDWSAGTRHVEVGCGTGPITRRMAARATTGQVIGVDPSAALIAHARELAGGLAGIEFETGDGATLRFDDDSIDGVVMHTVLSHVADPAVLLEEAKRILKPGGRLVVCDADFEKSSLGNFDGDPLDACATYFVRHFVTHPYLISDIRGIASSAGFAIDDFRIDSRAMTDTDGGLGWIRMGTASMVEQGRIGEELATALANEYVRRRTVGTLYGHQPFGTLLATNPDRQPAGNGERAR